MEILKYQNELLTILVCLGYTVALGILILTLIGIIVVVYRTILNCNFVFKTIYSNALDKSLKRTSEENLEKWFEDIRKRHKNIINNKEKTK